MESHQLSSHFCSPFFSSLPLLVPLLFSFTPAGWLFSPLLDTSFAFKRRPPHPSPSLLHLLVPLLSPSFYSLLFFHTSFLFPSSSSLPPLPFYPSLLSSCSPHTLRPSAIFLFPLISSPSPENQFLPQAWPTPPSPPHTHTPFHTRAQIRICITQTHTVICAQKHMYSCKQKRTHKNTQHTHTTPSPRCGQATGADLFTDSRY